MDADEPHRNLSLPEDNTPGNLSRNGGASDPKTGLSHFIKVIASVRHIVDEICSPFVRTPKGPEMMNNFKGILSIFLKSFDTFQSQLGQLSISEGQSVPDESHSEPHESRALELFPCTGHSVKSEKNCLNYTWANLIRAILTDGYMHKCDEERAIYFCGICNFTTLRTEKWYDHCISRTHIGNERSSSHETKISNCKKCRLTILHYEGFASRVYQSQSHQELDLFAELWGNESRAESPDGALSQIESPKYLQWKAQLGHILELLSDEDIPREEPIRSFYCDPCSFGSFAHEVWETHINSSEHIEKMEHRSIRFYACPICRFNMFSKRSLVDVILNSSEHMMIDRRIMKLQILNTDEFCSFGADSRAKPENSELQTVLKGKTTNELRKLYAIEGVSSTPSTIEGFVHVQCNYCGTIPNELSLDVHINSSRHIENILDLLTDPIITRFCYLCETRYAMFMTSTEADISMQSHVLVFHGKYLTKSNFFTASNADDAHFDAHPLFKKCVIMMKSGVLTRVTYCTCCLTVIGDSRWHQHLSEKKHISRSKTFMVLCKCNICKFKVYGKEKEVIPFIVAHMGNVHGGEVLNQYAVHPVPISTDVGSIQILDDLMKGSLPGNVLCYFCGIISSNANWRSHVLNNDHLSSVGHQVVSFYTCKTCRFSVYSPKNLYKSLVRAHVFYIHSKPSS